MYGTSPETFTPCGNMAFFGALGPVGTVTSGIVGDVDTGGLPFWIGAGCAPGDDENLEEMLDNHEFLLVVFGDGDTDFGRLPFSVIVFSVELLLEKLGRPPGIGLGDDAGSL